MIRAEFTEKRPFEIGDKVVVVAATPGKTGDFVKHIKTITDIACVHYVKTGRIESRYELDGSGIYTPLQIERMTTTIAIPLEQGGWQ